MLSLSLCAHLAFRRFPLDESFRFTSALGFDEGAERKGTVTLVTWNLSILPVVPTQWLEGVPCSSAKEYDVFGRRQTGDL